MRSRYTAYVRGEIDYLIATHHSKQPLDRAAIERFSRESKWQGLEILAVQHPAEDEGIVEFIARAEGFSHHERSRFAKIDGRWLYLDGDTPKPTPLRKSATPGRNDPCPCGSGKKYKKCHGA